MSRDANGASGMLARVLSVAQSSTESVNKPVIATGAALGVVGLVAGAWFWLRKKSKQKHEALDPFAQFMLAYQSMSPELQLEIAYRVLSQHVGGTAGAQAYALVRSTDARKSAFFVAPLPDKKTASVEFDLTSMDSTLPYLVAIAHKSAQPSSAQLLAMCARLLRQQQVNDTPAVSTSGSPLANDHPGRRQELPTTLALPGVNAGSEAGQLTANSGDDIEGYRCLAQLMLGQ